MGNFINHQSSQRDLPKSDDAVVKEKSGCGSASRGGVRG